MSRVEIGSAVLLPHNGTGARKGLRVKEGREGDAGAPRQHWEARGRVLARKTRMHDSQSLQEGRCPAPPRSRTAVPPFHTVSESRIPRSHESPPARSKAAQQMPRAGRTTVR